MANKVAILTDSTCDLGNDLLKEYNIDFIPLHVNFDNESYDDLVNINLEQLYQKVDEKGKLPTTSCPSQMEIKVFLEKYLNQGYDIVYTGISSEMSSTFHNFKW